MIDEIRQFVVDEVTRLNDGDDVSGATVLGGRGAGLESLSIAELAVLTENTYDIDLADEELEAIAEMTVDEFVTTIYRRAVPHGMGK